MTKFFNKNRRIVHCFKVFKSSLCPECRVLIFEENKKGFQGVTARIDGRLCPKCQGELEFLKKELSLYA
jgi:hypothetical protein